MSDPLSEIVGRIITAADAGIISPGTTEQSVLDKQQRGFRLSASEMILIYELEEKLEEKSS